MNDPPLLDEKIRSIRRVANECDSKATCGKWNCDDVLQLLDQLDANRAKLDKAMKFLENLHPDVRHSDVSAFLEDQLWEKISYGIRKTDD
jgi:hypothetical protein